MKIEFPVFVFASFTAQHPYRSSAGFLLIVVFVVLAVGMINVIFLMGSLVQLAVEDLILTTIGIFADAS